MSLKEIIEELKADETERILDRFEDMGHHEEELYIQGYKEALEYMDSYLKRRFGEERFNNMFPKDKEYYP